MLVEHWTSSVRTTVSVPASVGVPPFILPPQVRLPGLTDPAGVQVG